jgi:hypothetical protein
MDRGGHTSQINTHVVTGFVDLWFRKDERQRVLWSLTTLAGGGDPPMSNLRAG